MGDNLTEGKYGNQKASAKRRGIPFELSYEDWKQWWINTGHSDQRGRKKGCYVMARFNDIGPYSLTNIKCILSVENIAESDVGRAPLSEEQKEYYRLNHPNSRKIHTPIGDFISVAAAARALQTLPLTIRKRTKRWPLLYYYL